MSFRPSTERTNAVPRRAQYSGGWGVAWDHQGRPGRTASGARCETCGRSSFGIAGTGVSPSADMYRWPGEVRFIDGSFATYGLEGGTGPGWLAYVVVSGQECLYNVWSNVSEEHLRSLIGEMRFVEAEGVK